MGVGVVPLHEPELAMIELDFAIKSGLEAIWIPHYASGDRSPGHLSLDPFWQKLSEKGIPFLMHVGGSPLQLDKSWSDKETQHAEIVKSWKDKKNPDKYVANPDDNTLRVKLAEVDSKFSLKELSKLLNKLEEFDVSLIEFIDLRLPDKTIIRFYDEKNIQLLDENQN